MNDSLGSSNIDEVDFEGFPFNILPDDIEVVGGFASQVFVSQFIE